VGLVFYKRKKPCATSLMLLLESLPESNTGEREKQQFNGMNESMEIYIS